MVSEIASVVKSHPFSKPTGKEEMWKELQQLVLKSHTNTSWNEFIAGAYSNTKEMNIFHQTFFMNCIAKIMKFEHEKKELPKLPDIHLTDAEQEVLYYVAGYIVYSLRCKYKRLEGCKHKDIAVAALLFLDTLKAKGDENVNSFNFLEYTRKWVEITNRGGLIIVNNMFIMYRRIENFVRKVLNVDLIRDYKGQDIREVIEKELERDTLIGEAWETIARYLVNRNLSNVLKLQIIKKWVDIHAKAFVASYIQVVK